MSKLSSRGAAWDAVRLQCLDRDGWVCQYCGKHLIGSDATADHLTPRSQGGVDELWNLLAACRKCNGHRQDRVLIRTNYFNRAWLDRL